MEQVLGPQAHHSEKPVLKNRQPKSIVSMAMVPKAMYKVNAISLKFQTEFSTDIEVAILRLERWLSI
jgi:hypothetical protein